jgi:hypothetical protein
MRSIKARFKKFKKDGVGDYVVLHRSVKNQNFTKDRISKNFKELINPEDYFIRDILKLTHQLYEASNMLKEQENEVDLPRKA